MIDFNKMIDRHIAREHKPKNIGRYFPSEIGNCLRKVWYSYKYPLEVEPDLLKIFEVGNIMHGFIVEVLSSEKNKEVQLVKSEFPFKIEKKDFIISGRVDDLVLVKEDGQNLLVEVKSTKNVKTIDKAQHNHMIQLLFYMYATGVHDGVILYVDKNDLQCKVFEVKFSEERGKDIEERFAKLHNLLVNNKLPKAEAKEVNEIGWMCKFCEYSKKCEENSL